MLFGYARVSTNSQARDGNSLYAQVQALKQAGAIIIFTDVFSGSKNTRTQLDNLLNVIQSGDKIIPTGRLIRNIMLAFSEFERDLIIQRTREGKEIADKTTTTEKVAAMTGISRATLGRGKAKL